MATKDYANTRFSALNQINAQNVNQLKPAWTFSTGVTRGQEAGPLVVGDTMYIVTPFPNYLYALDLTKPGAPMKWKYDPRPAASAQGVACCDVVNRGAAYDNGRIFYNTLDNYTVAVDARSGQEVWKTKLGEINKGETMTMAPLVAGNKVIVGNSGGEFGVRGWVTALDAGSGQIAWRAYSNGSNAQNIFSTIVEGRPNGMPSFRGRLTNQQLWQIVAYVRSMSGQLAKDVSPSRGDEMNVKSPEQSKEKERPVSQPPAKP